MHPTRIPQPVKQILEYIQLPAQAVQVKVMVRPRLRVLVQRAQTEIECRLSLSSRTIVICNVSQFEFPHNIQGLCTYRSCFPTQYIGYYIKSKNAETFFHLIRSFQLSDTFNYTMIRVCLEK